MKTKMIALKTFSYAGHRIKSGKEFYAIKSDAKVLIALGTAKIAPAAQPSAPSIAKRPVRHTRHIATAPTDEVKPAWPPVPPSPFAPVPPSPFAPSGPSPFAPAPAPAESAESVDLEALRAEYLALYGVAPDGRWGDKKLAWAIASKKAE